MKPQVYLYDELGTEEKNRALRLYTAEEIRNMAEDPVLEKMLKEFADRFVASGVLSTFEDEWVSYFYESLAPARMINFIRVNEYLFDVEGSRVEIIKA